MTEVVALVGAAVGGMVGMAGALGYGAKKLVDALSSNSRQQVEVFSKQLQTQNGMIEKLHYGIKGDLDQHIDDCKICQSKSAGEAAHIIALAAADAAKVIGLAAQAAAAKVVKDS